jgi:hypothetical protein
LQCLPHAELEGRALEIERKAYTDLRRLNGLDGLRPNPLQSVTAVSRILSANSRRKSRSNSSRVSP